ncbi:MAG: peroxiredoxin [Acidimicrobiales bacterium]|jgi:peroxiredoxin Q/BCP
MHVGDLAPDFTLLDQNGTSRTLSTLLDGGPVALFFYPAAMTTGCTKESCQFRDLAGEFQALGAQRIGISMDSVQKQSEFTQKNQLDYPLLADVGGHVARQFGVKRSLDFLKVKRSTFVIDRNRRIVDIINSEINMNVHAERALDALKTLPS